MLVEEFYKTILIIISVLMVVAGLYMRTDSYKNKAVKTAKKHSPTKFDNNKQKKLLEKGSWMAIIAGLFFLFIALTIL